jgi:hypothetical protein
MTSPARASRIFVIVLIVAAVATGAWSGQLSATTPPQKNPIEIRKGGQVNLRLSAREAGTPPPSIAGDFTNWTPVRMKQHGNEWRFSVQLAAGVYRFAFRSASGEWFVPASFPNRTDDQMGGWVAVLVIP